MGNFMNVEILIFSQLTLIYFRFEYSNIHAIMHSHIQAL
jgi:hypothetical protein